MAKYGWFIRHERSGDFVYFEPETHRLTTVSSPAAASFFDKQQHAIDVAAHLSTLPLMNGIVLEVVDATIPDAPIETPTEHVPTREEILEAAHAAGEERRVKHAAARMAFKEIPSGVLLPHPGEYQYPAPKPRKAPAKAKRGAK